MSIVSSVRSEARARAILKGRSVFRTVRHLSSPFITTAYRLLIPLSPLVEDYFSLRFLFAHLFPVSFFPVALSLRERASVTSSRCWLGIFEIPGRKPIESAGGRLPRAWISVENEISENLARFACQRRYFLSKVSIAMGLFVTLKLICPARLNESNSAPIADIGKC